MKVKQDESLSADMVEATFEIKGTYFKNNCLPSLNDLLSEATKHPMAYNRLKKDMEWVITCALRRDLKNWKPNGRVKLNITYGEKSKGQKRDYDNVVSGSRKLINDAMVKAKYLQDDSPKYLGYGENTFVYTDKPFIRVEIVEDR